MSDLAWIEQAITAARPQAVGADVPFETPGAVAAMVYLLFNEGYSAGGAEIAARSLLCEEATHIRMHLDRLQQDPARSA